MASTKLVNTLWMSPSVSELFSFHHIRNVVQRRIVAQCHQLRVELCHRICLSRIFPRNFLEWYSHKQLNN